MRRHRHLLIAAALLAVTSMLAPARAHATVKAHPVQLRAAGPAPVLRPGERASITFEFTGPPTAKTAVQVTGLSVESRSLAAPFAKRATALSATAESPARFEVEVLPDEKPEPLVVRWEVDGVPYERTIDLESRLESRIAERQAMIRLDDSPVTRDPRVTAEADSVLRAKRLSGAGGTIIFFSGKLVYTRAANNGFPPIDMGAWGVRVSLMDQDTGPDDELAASYTGPDGSFHHYVYWEGQIGEGDPELYVHFETDHPWVVVQEGFWDIEYSWSTHARGSSTADLDVGTWRPSDEGTFPALHIANDIARSHEWYRTYPRDWFMPSVDVKWPDGSTGAYFDPIFEQIHIGTDRQWKEDTHAHEYGHFFVYTFADQASPSYCNGYCDSPDCGHCIWCPENEHVAFSEGWPNWVSYLQTSSYAATYGIAPVYSRDGESIEKCFVDNTWGNPEHTEGTFGAVLQDIWDSGPGSDDTDPNGFSGYRDWLELGEDEIFTVLTVDQPTTARGFLTRFAMRYPQYTQRIWQTAMNSRWNLDIQEPGVVTTLSSSSHPVGVSTAKLNVTLTWTQPGPDDWSGVAGYSVAFSSSPVMPDVVMEAGLGSAWTSGDLAAGTYYATVRTVDYSGKGSTTYATYGPFTVVTPTPVDIAPYTAAGWARPAVARAAGDALATSVPNPTAQLPGNTALTYLNASGRNQGQSDHVGFIGIRSRFFVDGLAVHTTGYVHPDAAGATFTHLNRSTTVRGGRHMIGVIYDGFNEWWESNEVNNYWSHPWVWSPLTLTPETATRRMTAPPVPTGSWSGVVDGSPLHYNCDGLRFSSSGWWNAVWVAADSDSEDYGIRLHAPSSSATSGFDTVLGEMNHSAGYLDGVLANRNTVGLGSWDVGVIGDFDGTNDFAPHSPFVVKHVTSTGFPFADTLAFAFPDSEYVVLKEVYVPAAGPVAITVWADSSGGPVHLSWLDRTYTRGALESPTWTFPSGVARLDYTASAAGFYCVVLHRDPKDGRAARPFTLGVGSPPSDIVAFTAPGWAGPVVPRPLADGFFDDVAAPDTLHGDAPLTWVNLTYGNAGPGNMVAATLPYDLRLDGQWIHSGSIVPVPPGFGTAYNNVGAFTVTGGRHLLAARYDTANLEPEESETNNHHGEQWVWSPRPLALTGGFSSTAPPDPVGGFETFAGAGALYSNSLGFRATFAAGSGLWGGVGVVPADSTDADLRLHDPVAGARDAFGASLRSSSWGPYDSDFLIVRHDAARTVDAGVVRGDDGAGGAFDIAATGAIALAAAPLTTADQLIGTQEALRLHPLLLPAGDIRLRLTNVAGTVDWGLSLHGDSLAVQGKSDALDAAWMAGAAGGEELIVHLAAPDTFVVAVWKRGGADRGQFGVYRLQADLVTLDTPPGSLPRVSMLAAAQPAPFRDRTLLAYDLAVAGEAQLEVFDLRGARVRTLARGRFEAGRHEVEWRGDDDGGRRLPPGMYLVRLQSGAFSGLRKVVKID
jgi:hypothetical protein